MGYKYRSHRQHISNPRTTMKHEIEQMEKTIDQNQSTLLEASISLVNLQKENQRLNALNSTFKIHLRNFLSSFEARFEKDPDQFVTDECYEYIDAARFMEKHFGRPSWETAVSIYIQNKKA